MGRKIICCKEEVCIGCRLCEIWCTVEHSKSKDIIKAFLYEKERAISRVQVEERGPVSFALQCKHCNEPDCVYACISGALHKENGIIKLDASKCVGCWSCVMACPYGAIIRDEVRGNSAGGIGAVEAIRDVDKKGKIIMVSDEEYHAYSRALIPYYLSEKTSFADIFIKPSDFYQSKDIVLILGKRVIDVDVEKKRVIILDDEDVIGYEKILIATGSKPIIPKFVGVEDTEFFAFTTLNDALIIKDEIETGKYKKAVVLGGGLIGLMASEALKKKGLDVTVVDLADRVLAPVLDKIGSCIVENHLEENNIHIITKHTIDKVLGEGSVILDGGTELPCEMLILAIGVKPRLELVQGKVKVNRG
ncbi:MAG: hypothetical protein EF806_04690 [Candidatus Methanoliparum thermophilum]|uniref:4Fe-4S ferredoxin-type domain-containing protein n=2 Tax=Candidatus Methanoliparum TaxID=2545692 RepID=A0A520KS83_METT2|nr:MAG: hypothetical protein EF806_04690 [Candidatus Methanoliparum thermophilum]